MLVSISSSRYINSTWDYKKNRQVCSVSKNRLDKDNTYVSIISEGQNTYYKTLKEDKEIKILYTSPKAVNKSPGHGTEPRNFVVIFELK